jgi:hypothetical protein
LPTLNVCMRAGEQLTESLLLRPLAAGWLRVTGVAWLLGGVAEGSAEFDVKGRRRKKPKGDRWAPLSAWTNACLFVCI